MNYFNVIQQSQAVRQQIKELARAWAKEDSRPIIAAWGMMNAGKSFLLNMLTQNIDEEYFTVNDHRETTDLKKFETESCIFLDTPGLDANDQDTKIALDGIKNADVVLFVHQMPGELEEVEISYLQEQRKIFGSHANKNIIMIFSKLDKVNAEKVDQIQARVLEQCQELMGFTPVCFQISNTRYQKGVKEQKPGLVEGSHIVELQSHLEDIILSDIGRVRQDRQYAQLNQLIIELKAIDEKLKDAQQQLRAPYKQAIEQAVALMGNEIIPELKKFRQRLLDV